MENVQKTLQIFCANCQNDVPHTGEVDLNGELVFTCTTPDCGRFIKVPAGMSAEEIHAYFVAQRESNVGQVSIAESYAMLAKVFESADSAPSTEPAEPEATAEQPAE